MEHCARITQGLEVSTITLLIVTLILSRADLEWKVVYVGSAESDEYDQELENVLVGPIPVGTNKFVLQVS